MAGIRNVTWLSIVLFTAFICMVKSYGSNWYILVKTWNELQPEQRQAEKKKEQYNAINFVIHN